eukprot:2466890-Rhodomonas_salina.1
MSVPLQIPNTYTAQHSSPEIGGQAPDQRTSQVLVAPGATSVPGVDRVGRARLHLALCGIRVGR